MPSKNEYEPIRSNNTPVVETTANTNDVSGSDEHTSFSDERTRLLSTLLDVSNLISSTMELQPLLEAILDRLGNILDYKGARIFILEGDSRLKLMAYRSTIRNNGSNGNQFAYDQALLINEVALSKAPLVIKDVKKDKDAVTKYNGLLNAGPDETCSYIRSWVGLPMIVKDRVVGILTIDHSRPDYYRAHHIELGMAFANQAAIEYENTRLRAEAEEMAVAAERNRIARDLHDSVTQTLFSASLIAEVLPRIWNKDHVDGQGRLEELRQLTRGALAEMRTLLLELRPAALVEAPFTDLLKQLAEAATSRASIPVSFAAEGCPALPVDVKIGIYRIAQEAVNNIVKYSGATEADICLKGDTAAVELMIRDNGRGFDPACITGEHLGLGIMKERADSIGAALEINSSPGLGAEIVIRWGNNTGI